MSDLPDVYYIHERLKATNDKEFGSLLKLLTLCMLNIIETLKGIERKQAIRRI